MDQVMEEWRIQRSSEKFFFSRVIEGRTVESYRPVERQEASVWAACIIQGFEPPRRLTACGAPQITPQTKVPLVNPLDDVRDPQGRYMPSMVDAKGYFGNPADLGARVAAALAVASELKIAIDKQRGIMQDDGGNADYRDSACFAEAVELFDKLVAQTFDGV